MLNYLDKLYRVEQKLCDTTRSYYLKDFHNKELREMHKFISSRAWVLKKRFILRSKMSLKRILRSEYD